MWIDPRVALSDDLLVPERRGDAIDAIARLPVSARTRVRAAIYYGDYMGFRLHDWELDRVKRGLPRISNAHSPN